MGTIGEWDDSSMQLGLRHEFGMVVDEGTLGGADQGPRGFGTGCGGEIRQVLARMLTRGLAVCAAVIFCREID
jgi:hypothetical protein